MAVSKHQSCLCKKRSWYVFNYHTYWNCKDRSVKWTVCCVMKNSTTRKSLQHFLLDSTKDVKEGFFSFPVNDWRVSTASLLLCSPTTPSMYVRVESAFQNIFLFDSVLCDDFVVGQDVETENHWDFRNSDIGSGIEWVLQAPSLQRLLTHTKLLCVHAHTRYKSIKGERGEKYQICVKSEHSAVAVHPVILSI